MTQASDYRKQSPMAGPSIWGILQIMLLIIGASGFPLWSHHPIPREALSLAVLVVGQFIFASLFFPVLSGDVRSLLLCLAITVPIDMGAGLLSSVPQALIWECFAATAVWLIGWAGWGFMSSSIRVRSVLTGWACIWLLGGVILDYLRLEAHVSAGESDFQSPLTLLPQLGLAVHTQARLPWLQIAFPLLAVSLFQVSRLIRRKS